MPSDRLRSHHLPNSTMKLIYETPEFSDDEIILTGHGLDDIPSQVAGEDDEMAKRLGWWPNRSTAEHVLAAYRAWARDWREDGPTRAFAVRSKHSGELLGGCQLRRHDEGPMTVSYWTAVQHRRKGVATRGLKLLLKFAASEGVTELACDVAEDNII